MSKPNATGWHTPTRTSGVRKRGKSYRWESYIADERGTCSTYAEAVEAKKRADERGPQTHESFGAYASDWIASYGGRRRGGAGASTRKRYEEALRLYAIPYFDTIRKRKFSAVTRRDAKAFAAWLLEQPIRGDKTMSANTANHHLAAVRIMYADAIDDDVIRTANPFEGVHPNARGEAVDLDADRRRRRPLSADAVARVLAASGQHRLMFDVLVETGIRWGELSELRGTDLDRDDDGPALQVFRGWDAVGSLAGRPKSGKVRTIPISPELARGLMRLQRRPGELLFQSPLGERMNYQNTLTRVLKPTLAAASDDQVGDLTWAGFHTFRHTNASLLYAAGYDPLEIAARLGHHKASYSIDTYVHSLPGRRRHALDVSAALENGRSMAGCAPGTARNDSDTAPAETRD